jgi:hypothetical protein
MPPISSILRLLRRLRRICLRTAIILAILRALPPAAAFQPPPRLPPPNPPRLPPPKPPPFGMINYSFLPIRLDQPVKKLPVTNHIRKDKQSCVSLLHLKIQQLFLLLCEFLFSDDTLVAQSGQLLQFFCRRELHLRFILVFIFFIIVIL